MKFWVGVTDKNWFDYLSNISPDEVNFWKPGGQGFGVLQIGEPFLFKLHKSLNRNTAIKLHNTCKSKFSVSIKNHPP